MTVQAAERKSVVGLKDLYYALITQDDENAYAAATPVYFAPAVNASQAPASNSQTQYADDGPFDTLTAEGETAITIEITAIPLQVLATVLGKVYDAATGRMFDNGGTPPEVAFGFRSKKSNGSYKYFWFLKGRFSAPSEEAATQTDSPDPKTTSITFTAVKTLYQFDLDGGTTYDGVKRVVGDEDADNFSGGSTWFDSVQVPSAGSPSALTCTPSPTDGASGQAVDVTITLTFSNPIAGDAEDGVVLVDADAYAIFATTKSLNAARTVLTLAHANLSATTNYNIVVAGVMDIYGQALSDVVYDFATT